MRRLRFELVDGCGTSYRPSRWQAGGSGTEWRGEWGFRPGVPEAARRLVIHVHVDGARNVHLVELILR